jgi:hypothetical protein
MIRQVIFLLMCFVAIPFTVSAAGPVAHVYLAEKFFELFPERYSEQEKERFILGTLFPDIRYISDTRRDHTHDDDVSIKEILEQSSPFVAGMKYHSWVDHVRDHYVLADEIYDRLPNELTIEQKPSFLKVIEDELLLEQLDVEFCCDLLERVDPEELEHGVTEQDISQWHAFLVFFFKTSPRTTVTLLSLVDSGRSYPTNEDMEMWMSLINPAIKSDVGIDHTRNLVRHVLDKIVQEKQALEGSYDEHIK